MTATIIPTAPPRPPGVMDTRYRRTFLVSDVLVSSMRCNINASTSARRPAKRTPVSIGGPGWGRREKQDRKSRREKQRKSRREKQDGKSRTDGNDPNGNASVWRLLRCVSL